MKTLLEFHGLDFYLHNTGKLAKVVVGVEATEAAMSLRLFGRGDNVLHAGTGLGLTALHILSTGATAVCYEAIPHLIPILKNGIRVRRERLDIRHGAIVPDEFAAEYAQVSCEDVLYVTSVKAGGSLSAPAVKVSSAIIADDINALSMDVEGLEFDLLRSLSVSPAFDRINKMHVEFHVLSEPNGMIQYANTIAMLENNMWVVKESFMEYEVVDYDTRECSQRISVIHCAFVRRK